MALASQTPRTNTFRGGNTRNQRKSARAVLLAAGALVGITALAVVAVWRLGTGSPPPASATTPAGTPAAPVGTPAGVQAPASTTTPAPKAAAASGVPVAPAPVIAAKPATPAPTPTPIPSSTPTPVVVPAAPVTQPAVAPAKPVQADAPATTNPASTAPVTPPATPATTPPPIGTDPASGLPADISELVRTGAALMAKGDLLGARFALNKALLDARTPAAEREGLRRQIAALNETLVFSPTVALNDLLFGSYTVVSGDSITKVMRSQAPFVDRLFLGRINKMADVNKLNVGKRLKVPRQPFHLIVHKDAFRADLYMGPPLPPDATISSTQPIEARLGGWTYIRSFAVGLGESNGTPEGLFAVRPNSKLINPEWINPRDRTRFAPDDPANPIGEHWIGLEGAEERTKTFAAYGMHGTIHPDSIGKEQSMGCVRMLAGDIAMVYEVMAEKVSHVWIVR